MSLLPLLSRNWWDTWDYPSRVLDQNFGMGLIASDLLGPRMNIGGLLLRPRTQGNINSSGISEVLNDKDVFKVMLNVSHFKPGEIEVKTVDNSIVVHGQHEEKTDEHGFVSRQFTRRYMLPEGTEPETVVSSLSSDGVLTIEAPKKSIESPPTTERVVPVSIEAQEKVVEH